MAKSKATIVVRILTSVSSLIAAIVMGRSHQSGVIVQDDPQNWRILTVKYYYFGSFTYFFYMNLVCCLYNLFVCFVPDRAVLWRLVIIVDMAWGMLMSTGVGITWTYYKLLSEGNMHGVQWAPICYMTSAFCKDILGAFIAGVIAFATHCGLLAYMAVKLFKPFESM